MLTTLTALEAMTDTERALALVWGKTLDPKAEIVVLKQAMKIFKTDSRTAREVLDSLILELHQAYIDAEAKAHEGRVNAHNKAWTTRLAKRDADRKEKLEKMYVPSSSQIC